jgi:hypothetical protein
LSVIPNFVYGTRLNQDVLAATYSKAGRNFEAFGIDSWYTFYLADRLSAGSDKAQREFATGRTMYDAGVLLGITDGSLDLLQHIAK